MMWDLPLEVIVDGNTYHITNDCDYRVVLDVICALNDSEMSIQDRVICALLLFYKELTRENILDCPYIDELQKEMFRIINGGEVEEQANDNKPKLMDWEHDFPVLVAPINRVLGYEVRSASYLHFYTFLSAYYEIGECTFSTIVSIRFKKAKGQKLDKWEIDYIREHRKMVELPQKITTEEEALLNSEW